MGVDAQYRASLERVLTRLEQVTGREARQEGGQWKTLCPAHNDRTPSLTVKHVDDATFIHCHAGCTGNKPHSDPTAVLRTLGLELSDLFDRPLERSSGSGRRVTDLADRRRQRAAKPTKYQVTEDLAPRIEPSTPKGSPIGEPYVQTWTLYQHPDTLDVDWAAIRIVQPLDDGGYDKRFFYAHRDDRARGKRLCLGENPDTGRKMFQTLPDGWASKLPTEPRRQTLLYLGQLRTDIAAGRTIYVVEGESDATAGRFAGMAATTAPKGAGKWQAHHSEELRGADVVIVADCDDKGIQGAETIARSLLGKAKSIRTVQARVGKDLRDHLAAGHGAEDLVEIDLGIPELHPDRAASHSEGTPIVDAQAGDQLAEPDDYSDAPGPPSQIIDDSDAPNEKPTYLIRHGELVERTWRTEGKGEDAVYRARYRAILGCAAWVTGVTEEDDGEERGRYEAVTRDLVLQLERRTRDGELLDEMPLRLPMEWMKTGEWVGHWPWPDTILGRKRSDVDKAVAAIHQARTAPTRRTKVHVATGWRDTETGPIFIHGGGAIGRGGHLDVDVDLDAVLSRTALPEPTEDAATLRAALWHGTDPLRQLPARIAAPLRGLVFASLVAPIEMVTHLHGPKGTKKTAAARLHLQHFAPQLRFPNVKEMVSGASNLSSPKGMARMLGRAKDILLEIDDLAPDRGGAAEARTRLAELARAVYNRSSATKATFRPGQIVNELPPRCSLLTTGEIVADGSAGSRCFNIAIEAGIVTDELITDLEAGHRVDARGILGASFIMWVAQRREALLQWREELRNVYLRAWRKSLRDLPYTSDILSRVSEAARDYTVGELFFLTFLLDRGAITEDEASEMWQWSINGIRQAAGAIDAETSDVAANIIWTIKDLLATGRAHLTDKHGNPPQPEDDPYAPQRWGYTAQQRNMITTVSGHKPDIIWRENGARLGAVTGDRVYLIPAETEFQARQHRQRAERPWTETTASMASALDQRGWLKTHVEAKTGKLHRSVGRDVYGSTTRVWDLPRALFDLDGFDDDGGDFGDDTPNPLDPLLTRRPGWLEIPMDEAEQQQASELPAAVGFDGPAAHTINARAETKPSSSLQAVQPQLHPQEPLPAAAAGPPDTTTSAEQAATPPASLAGSTPVDPEWTLRLMVVDVDGLYLPQQDGQVHTIPLTDPPSPADIAEFADGFGLRHGSRGVGHVYLSPRLSDHFGLVIDDDLTHVVDRLKLHERKDLRDKKSRRNAAAAEQLAERGAAFADELRAAGWEVQKLRPRFTIRRPDPAAPGDAGRTRVFTIVLEAYSYMWESKEDDLSGPDQRRYPLPDPDERPAEYCTALAARLGRAGELLDVPWQWSAASTGAELVARLPVRMPREEEDWRRQGPEQVPAAVMQSARVAGQGMWEPHNKWARTPREEELAAATELWLFDERGSYLPRAGSLQFGYGQPERIEAGELVKLLRLGKAPYGLTQIDLPSWDVDSLPPPHPDMVRGEDLADGHVTRRWTTLRTPWLLANAHKHSQFDLSDDLEAAIAQAWVWPKTHRLFGVWADRIRTMRVHAEEQAQLADQKAEAAADPGERAMWTAEAANWHAVEMMSRGVYSGYIGKLGSRRVVANEAAAKYHFHYRPVAQATIWGEQRVQAWIKLARYAKTTGVAPLFASGTDSYGYLAPALDEVIPQPDVDNGRFGKLRVKHRVALTDDMRQQLRDGMPGYQVFDLEVARLARGGEIT